MSCCNTYIELGCFDVCSQVTLDQLYTQTGLHTIEFKFNNFTLKRTLTVASGDPIVLDLTYLNEDTLVEIRIQQPDRTYMDCFRLKTNIYYAD